ncbi:MATE family efflux transporter [Paenibacillus hexagrammi]|uniref:Probable multidrug resistance protein NorM n=1 Tax=Paenibacillus hexagrammi TaxID=2908839 RepID=A0ABY3SHQ2_9BACL|nr:MATE family efflux transporter [Paenibacillus sp. YPD9-1]UJF33422.1 MATE family efflux transporter [Paenibacillus sp. YPD9-1]
MQHAATWKSKITLFLQILLPILVTQISYNAMTVLDTMMSGRAGTSDLAGVAIGASLWMPIAIGLSGIMLAVTPMVAGLYGGGQHEQIAKVVTQALYLAVLLAVVIIILGSVFLEPVLGIMHLDAAVQDVAKRYLTGLSIGIIPLFASSVLRNFFDAQGFTRISMVILLIAVPVNALLNYALIFGELGFPRLGGAGAGYATAITYWLIMLLNVIMVFRVEATRRYRLLLKWYRPSWQAWKEQLSIGVPIGLSIFFEASIFSVVTLLMGTMFDTVKIAAHQAAINFSSLLFMVPLSISSALTILVAYELGADRPKDARAYSRFGIFSAIGLMGTCSIFLYLLRGDIAMLYSSQREVILWIKQFLIYAAFYQLSDAAQASLQGTLRGYKDTSVPFIIALISYWGVGIPAGYMLASHTALGPFGFWVGIIVGLTSAAIGFAVRLRSVQKKTDARSATV